MRAVGADSHRSLCLLPFYKQHEARLQNLRTTHERRERDVQRRLRLLSEPSRPSTPAAGRCTTPSSERSGGLRSVGSSCEEPSAPATPAPTPLELPIFRLDDVWLSRFHCFT